VKVNTIARNYSWNRWSTTQEGETSPYISTGHAGDWYIAGYDNSHINIGDTAYITGTVGDRWSDPEKTINQNIIIYGVVTNKDSNYLYMTTSHYEVDG
jgi:hypothetical protein